MAFLRCSGTPSYSTANFSFGPRRSQTRSTLRSREVKREVKREREFKRVQEREREFKRVQEREFKRVQEKETHSRLVSKRLTNGDVEGLDLFVPVALDLNAASRGEGDMRKLALAADAKVELLLVQDEGFDKKVCDDSGHSPHRDGTTETLCHKLLGLLKVGVEEDEVILAAFAKHHVGLGNESGFKQPRLGGDEFRPVRLCVDENRLELVE